MAHVRLHLLDIRWTLVVRVPRCVLRVGSVGDGTLHAHTVLLEGSVRHRPIHRTTMYGFCRREVHRAA
jgi:hypothetical protein